MRKVLSILLIFSLLVGQINFNLQRVEAASTFSASDISLTQGGTVSNPTVVLNVTTDQAIAGVTIAKGYGNTATKDSQRLFGVKPNTNYTINNVLKYVSVYVQLADGSNATQSITLTGNRAFNSGSSTFAPFPTTPLTDSTTTKLKTKKISQPVGGDNGPMAVIDDEVWVFGENDGNAYIYKQSDADQFFNSTSASYSTAPNQTTTMPYTTLYLRDVDFNEFHTSIAYDGRYVFVRSTNYPTAGVYMIEKNGNTKTPVWSTSNAWDDTKYKAEIEKYIVGYSANLHGKTAAIAYDNTNLYFVTNDANMKLYKATPNANGTYTLQTTPVYTCPTAYITNANYRDMVYDGKNIWITTNGAGNAIVKFDTTTNTGSIVTTNAPTSKVLYDGGDNVYTMGAEAIASANAQFIEKININTNAVTKVYTDLNTPTYKEDFNFDGRNVWVHIYSNDNANNRYDTVSGTKISMTKGAGPTFEWNTNSGFGDVLNTSVSGTYDGKYEWTFAYGNGIRLIGRDTGGYDLKYGPNTVAMPSTNLSKYFSENPTISTDTTVYVDTKETTKPDFVDVKTSAGNSTSDIVQVAWSYSTYLAGANTKTTTFFRNLANFADDSTFDGDWTKYAGTSSKYFDIAKDSSIFPVRDSNGNFDFVMPTYPKLNGYYTVYMRNAQGKDIVETIQVNNYKELGMLYIKGREVDKNGTPYNPAVYVYEDLDNSYPVGSSQKISIAGQEADLLEKGYMLYGAKEKTVTIPASGEVEFYFTKDMTKWANVYAKPYYTDASGNKVYLTYTPAVNLKLVSDDKNTGRTGTIDAPHINGYRLKVITDSSKTVDLLKTDGGKTKDVYGDKPVEFEYVANTPVVAHKGIEVDATGKPTGNVVYTEQVKGEELKSATVTAKTDANYTLKGLVNYNTDGTFKDITNGVSSKTVTFGTDEMVAFAYTRNTTTVTTRYLDANGIVLGSDTYTSVPTNSSFNVFAGVVDNYKLENSAQYKDVVSVGATPVTYDFKYVGINEPIIVRALLNDTSGKVLAQSSVSLPLGSTNQSITADELVTMLAPKYVLDTSKTPSPYTLATVTQGAKVDFVFKEQVSTVTVNYVDATGKALATAKTYTIPYGDTIRENAISIDNCYFDDQGGTVSASFEKVANQPTETITFKYKASNGSISVVAKDKNSGAVLSYKVYSGTQGNTLTIDSAAEFAGKPFLAYYKLNGSATQSMNYTSSHQEMIFNYDIQNYTVTIKAVDENNAPLSFFDATTSKTFTYKQGDKYNVYAPPVTGYAIQDGKPKVTTSTGITQNETFTFEYEKINTDVNLTIKAISEDGKTIIGAKVITGTRNTSKDLLITDYPEIYDSNQWELADVTQKNVTFGTDTVATFKFKRKNVDLIVRYIDTTNGNAVLKTEATIQVPTNSKHTTYAVTPNYYELATGQSGVIVTDIGINSPVYVDVNCSQVSGNVLVEAVDTTSNLILEKKYYNIPQDTAYNAVRSDLSIDANTNYTYNGSSDTTIANVDADASKNVITLKYDRVNADVTVKYVDDKGVDIVLPKTYKAHYGTPIDEYALNIDYYNLAETSQERVQIDSVNDSIVSGGQVTYDSATKALTITFTYYKVDYRIVTDGVINFIAKDRDGNIIRKVSLAGTIGDTATTNATTLFGNLTGYTLVDTQDVDYEFQNGFQDIEFLYDNFDIKVNVLAEDNLGNKLTFADESQIDVQEGTSITVKAPVIDGYQITGYELDGTAGTGDSVSLTNITSTHDVKFIYKPIGKLIVKKGIEVDKNNVPTGEIVYMNAVAGSDLKTLTINAREDLENWTLVGLVVYNTDGTVKSIDTSKKSKDITFGTDEEATFAYTRKMLDVTATYVEEGTGVVLGTEKVNVPLNSDRTFTAKAIDGYKLVDPAQFSQTIKVTDATADTTVFTYKKLTEGVVLEATLADGTVIARDSIDLPLGSTDQTVTATELSKMLAPRYVLVDSATNSQTVATVEGNTVVKFVYVEKLSTVTVNYVDATGTTLATAKTYTVPYGQAVRESALSIKNYYLDTTVSTPNVEYLNADKDYTINFTYKKSDGDIAVVAKDVDTGYILYYKSHSGVQGDSLAVNANTEFANEDFVNYYELDASSNPNNVMQYSDTHQEMVFNYKKIEYNVTINATNNAGEALKFYDDTTEKVFTYKKGDKYTIFAPPVTGYKLVDGTANETSNSTGITQNETFTFKYVPIDTDTFLTVKAVSADGKIVIGTKTITGTRNDTATLDIKDFSEIYNAEDWELTGASTVNVKYGTDKEAVFKFTRKQVTGTINYVDETTGQIISSAVYDVDTNTSKTVQAIVIPDYVLADGESLNKTINIGTQAETVVFKYISLTGNVRITAVDEDGKPLMLKGVNANTSTTYTADPADFIKALAPGYIYDNTSNATITVDADSSKNDITLKFKKAYSKVTVKYLDGEGTRILPDSTYDVQFGKPIDEYAINIDFHNLTSNPRVQVATATDATYEIVFTYVKVAAGVVNVIAKDTSGKVIDFETLSDDIGRTIQVTAKGVFGDRIVGYVYNGDDTPKDVVVEDGYQNIEYIFDENGVVITIKAVVANTGEALTFSEPSTITTKVGDSITVHAPHVSAYEVITPQVDLTNVQASQEVVFKYNKIDVPATINVKHISYINGSIVMLKNEVLNGYIGGVATVSPIPADEVLAMGYKVDTNSDYTKTLFFGTDTEYVVLYDRIMSDFTQENIVEIFNSSADVTTNTVKNTLTEAEKATKAPSLVNVASKVPTGTYKTVIAPVAEDYVINTNKTSSGLRQSVFMDTVIKKVSYYYRNITGNVLVRAVIEDENGSIIINGKNYKLLAQVDDDCAVGVAYNSAKAKSKVSELEKLLDPAYVYDNKTGIISGNESFTMGANDTYKDHTLTYVFTADYKTVKVSYKDENGVLLNPSLLGVKSNPVETKVIKGDYISEYALSVPNHNFKNSTLSTSVSAKMAKAASGSTSTSNFYNTEVNTDTEISFSYTPIAIYNPVSGVKVYTKSGSTDLGTDTVDWVLPGTKIYAPYREGYTPTVEYINVPAVVDSSYSFEYVKLVPEKVTEKVYVSGGTSIVYVDRGNYSTIDYSGQALTHNKYIDGYEDGTVGVDKNITRAEVAQMLYNILYNAKTDKASYPATNLTDVDQEAWYADAVNYMDRKGYIKGYDDGEFKPERNITREELATIMSNIYGTAINIDYSTLPLDPTRWSSKHIVKAYASGLFNGFNLANYDYSKFATRAEVIVMINNGTLRVPNETYLDNNAKVPKDLNKGHWAYYDVLEAMTSHTGHYEGNFGKEKEVIDRSSTK